MQSLTIDIINNKAIKLLQDLEQLHLIRIQKQPESEAPLIDWSAKYKGSMTKEPLAEVNKQLNDLRSEWE